MPIVLLAVGLILVITSYQGTVGALARELRSDFTGAGNFFYWIAAISVIGAFGYYAPARTPARMFLVLVMLAMIIANKGVFSQAIEALRAGPTSPPKDAVPAGDAPASAAVPSPAAGAAAASGLQKQSSVNDNLQKLAMIAKFFI